MSPERMTQLDKLLQASIDASERAMELSVKNAEAIAGLAEFAAMTKDRLANLDEDADKDVDRGLQCRREVEGMIQTLRGSFSELKSRFNYVLGGIAVLGGLWLVVIGLFLKHVIG
jgi:hypothetical protein